MHILPSVHRMLDVSCGLHSDAHGPTLPNKSLTILSCFSARYAQAHKELETCWLFHVLIVFSTRRVSASINGLSSSISILAKARSRLATFWGVQSGAIVTPWRLTACTSGGGTFFPSLVSPHMKFAVSWGLKVSMMPWAFSIIFSIRSSSPRIPSVATAHTVFEIFCDLYVCASSRLRCTRPPHTSGGGRMLSVAKDQMRLLMPCGTKSPIIATILG
mmetsp:Transcript_53269/g.130088  ORF Transcript_53269/g.130088 Transcript_53269/m.130088 type:complete len:217 (-) Transcript_53269:176-826(-)